MGEHDQIEGSSWRLLNRAELAERIDRLPVSADAKALLMDLAQATVEIGGKLVAAGQRILSFIFDLIKRYPNTAFGVIVGFVLNSLLASVPVLGPLLSALLGPLLVALGLGLGAIADFRERAIIVRVRAFEGEFQTVETGDE